MRTRPVPTRVSVAMASARARGRVMAGPTISWTLQIAFEVDVPPLHRALGVRQARARQAAVPDGVLGALSGRVPGDHAGAEARLDDALERENASDHEEG